MKNIEVKKNKHVSSSDSGEESDRESESTSPSSKIQIPIRRPSIIATSLRTQHYGSFYLRMGAVGKISDFNLCAKLLCKKTKPYLT